jgi:hypothetical protein
LRYRQPASAVTFSRRNIFKRDRYVCQYCGAQPGTGELTIDHVVPRSQGGASSWTNYVLACVACNKRKADRTPRGAGMTLRREPIRPTWKPVYADQHARLESWSKFVSDVYWNAQLEEGRRSRVESQRVKSQKTHWVPTSGSRLLTLSS